MPSTLHNVYICQSAALKLANEVTHVCLFLKVATWGCSATIRKIISEPNFRKPIILALEIIMISCIATFCRGGGGKAKACKRISFLPQYGDFWKIVNQNGILANSMPPITYLLFCFTLWSNQQGCEPLAPPATPVSIMHPFPSSVVKLCIAEALSNWLLNLPLNHVSIANRNWCFGASWNCRKFLFFYLLGEVEHVCCCCCCLFVFFVYNLQI